MSLINWINTRVIGDERGHLVALEENKNIPFDIKRVYYLTGMQKDLPRGFHAHKALKQVAVCVNGSCEMILDDGVHKENVYLNSFEKALIIDSFVWHEMHNFSDDCVLMVIASDHYDEQDYIRSYEEFKLIVKR